MTQAATQHEHHHVQQPHQRSARVEIIKLDPKSTWIPLGVLVAIIPFCFLVGQSWADIGDEDHTTLIVLEKVVEQQGREVNQMRADMKAEAARNAERWELVREDLYQLKAALHIPQPNRDD